MKICKLATKFSSSYFTHTTKTISPYVGKLIEPLIGKLDFLKSTFILSLKLRYLNYSNSIQYIYEMLFQKLIFSLLSHPSTSVKQTKTVIQISINDFSFWSYTYSSSGNEWNTLTFISYSTILYSRWFCLR